MYAHSSKIQERNWTLSYKRCLLPCILIYIANYINTILTTAVGKDVSNSFQAGSRHISTNYQICLQGDASPVQHTSRHVTVALRDQIKTTLDRMVKAHIITPVTDPTPWIRSMVVVPKKSGALCICLDPKELNKAMHSYKGSIIRCWQYRMLPHAHLMEQKYFSTVLDVCSGFWHAVLDEPSSFLTTFIPLLVITNGTECPLEYVQHQKYFNAVCTK